MIKSLTSQFPQLILKGYESLYPFYKKQFNPSLEHWQYSLTAKQIYNAPRQQGVSGYYRIYNEEDFLTTSVLSFPPFFDEIILVHDRTTTDKTPEIAQALANQYSDKIKYFVYEPEAFKLRTKAYKILPANHPNSFVNYYNFALSKTTKAVVTKIDGDHIAIDTMFAKIIQNNHNMDFMRDVYYMFNGIDLWYCDNELYVDPFHIPGIDGDQGFHVMSLENNYYEKGTKTEQGDFMAKNCQLKNAGILYFHLKNMRSDIPYHSYRGLNDDIHQKKFKKKFFNVQKRLLDWKTFVAKYRDSWLQKTTTDISELPDPNEYLETLLKTIPSIDTNKLLS